MHFTDLEVKLQAGSLVAAFLSIPAIFMQSSQVFNDLISGVVHIGILGSTPRAPHPVIIKELNWQAAELTRLILFHIVKSHGGFAFTGRQCRSPLLIA